MKAAIALLIAAAAPAATMPPIFAVPTIDQHGAHATLGEVVSGRITVLHFMYPGCLSFCPMSGAVLARTQALLGEARAYQIVSISILPAETTPFRLARWLKYHRAAAGWRALFIDQPHLGQVMRSYGETVLDVRLHSSQMMVLNEGGRVVRRFDDIPAPEQLAAAIRHAMQRR